MNFMIDDQTMVLARANMRSLEFSQMLFQAFHMKSQNQTKGNDEVLT